MVDERYRPPDRGDLPRPAAVRVETEVTFEDGRKGRIEADLVIRDTTAARSRPWPGPPDIAQRAPTSRTGEVLLAVDNISCASAACGP